MADDNSAQSKDTWPLVNFSFQVKWDDQELIKVTGLSSETQAMNI
jgi:hypothetical protein